MTSFKIATWNVNSLRVRLPHVLTWLADVKPDVLALQELKLPTEDFPVEALLEAGYHAVVSGQRTYNGVAVLSRGEQVVSDIVTDLPGLDDPQRRVLGVTMNGIRILNLYVPNGESVTSEKYQYKLTWLSHLHAFVKAELVRHEALVMLGDFNIAPDERDVHDPGVWDGQVLFSEKERAALDSLCQLGLEDCFRKIFPEETQFSWWDYRMNAFKRNRGLRIDHILASQSLAAQCVDCYIDKAPRAWDRPSDHAPVVASFKR